MTHSLRNLIYEQAYLAEQDHKQSINEVQKLIVELNLLQKSINDVEVKKYSSLISFPVALKFLVYYLFSKKEDIGLIISQLSEFLDLKSKIIVSIYNPNLILDSNNYKEFSETKKRIEDALVKIYRNLFIFIKSMMNNPKKSIKIQLEDINFPVDEAFINVINKQIEHEKLYSVIQRVDQLNNFYITKKEINFLLSKLNIEKEKRFIRKNLPIQLISDSIENLPSDDKKLILEKIKNTLKRQIAEKIKLTDQKKLFYKKDTKEWDEVFYSKCWDDARKNFIEKS